MATALSLDLATYLPARLERCREAMAAANLDALLVTDPANRRYLSGFTGSAGMLLITPEQQYLATDSRYYTQCEHETPLFELIRAGYGYAKGIAEAVDLSDSRIGLEKEHVTLAAYEQLHEAIPTAHWTPTSVLIQKLRAIKDPYEMALMRTAIAMGDAAMEQVVTYAKPGVTENELITHYLRIVREVGADGPSYEPIFGGGPNAAIIHHRGSDRPLEAGDVLLIDAGVKYKGYCSDLTRCFLIEQDNAKMRELYEIVLASHEYGYQVSGPGVAAKEVDLQTRKLIEDAGYGEFYGHSFGHGIGLDVHEIPRVSRLSEDTIEVGMLHTIEPGIYLPGEGGIRVEDICAITSGGAVPVTGISKALRILQN